MNDTQIETFLKVAEYGSFSKAEEAGFLSKQAMLKQINSLEEEVGCPLLARGRSGTSLTEAGKLFRDGILQLNEARSKLIMNCREAAGIRPAIRVSTVEHQVILSPVNALFSKKYPDIPLVNVIHPNHSGEWRVANDLQDVAETSRDYGSDELDSTYTPLLRCHYAAAMRRNHPLSGKQTLTLAELTAYPTICFIMLGPEKLRILTDLFSECPEHLTIREDVDHQVEAAYSCINQDSILITANPFIYSINELVTVPLDVDWTREYGMIYREPVTYPLRKYIDLAVSYYKEYGEM